MPLLAAFVLAFGAVYLYFRRKGEKTADCLHKGFVAGILTVMVVFLFATVLSYV